MGSKWPKVTLGSLRDADDHLTLEELEKLRAIAVDIVADASMPPCLVRADRLTYVDFMSRSLHRRRRELHLPFAPTSADADDVGAHVDEYTARVVAEFYEPETLHDYHPYVKKQGCRAAHYREQADGATLVVDIGHCELPLADAWVDAIEKALPGRYDFFERHSRHITTPDVHAWASDTPTHHHRSPVTVSSTGGRPSEIGFDSNAFKGNARVHCLICKQYCNLADNSDVAGAVTTLVCVDASCSQRVHGHCIGLDAVQSTALDMEETFHCMRCEPPEWSARCAAAKCAPAADARVQQCDTCGLWSHVQCLTPELVKDRACSAPCLAPIKARHERVRRRKAALAGTVDREKLEKDRKRREQRALGKYVPSRSKDFQRLVSGEIELPRHREAKLRAEEELREWAERTAVMRRVADELGFQWVPYADGAGDRNAFVVDESGDGGNVVSDAGVLSYVCRSNVPHEPLFDNGFRAGAGAAPERPERVQYRHAVARCLLAHVKKTLVAGEAVRAVPDICRKIVYSLLKGRAPPTEPPAVEQIADKKWWRDGDVPCARIVWNGNISLREPLLAKLVEMLGRRVRRLPPPAANASLPDVASAPTDDVVYVLMDTDRWPAASLARFLTVATKMPSRIRLVLTMSINDRSLDAKLPLSLLAHLPSFCFILPESDSLLRENVLKVLSTPAYVPIAAAAPPQPSSDSKRNVRRLSSGSSRSFTSKTTVPLFFGARSIDFIARYTLFGGGSVDDILLLFESMIEHHVSTSPLAFVIGDDGLLTSAGTRSLGEHRDLVAYLDAVRALHTLLVNTSSNANTNELEMWSKLAIFSHKPKLIPVSEQEEPDGFHKFLLKHLSYALNVDDLRGTAGVVETIKSGAAALCEVLRSHIRKKSKDKIRKIEQKVKGALDAIAKLEDVRAEIRAESAKPEVRTSGAAATATAARSTSVDNQLLERVVGGEVTMLQAAGKRKRMSERELRMTELRDRMRRARATCHREMYVLITTVLGRGLAELPYHQRFMLTITERVQHSVLGLMSLRERSSLTILDDDSAERDVLQIVFSIYCEMAFHQLNLSLVDMATFFDMFVREYCKLGEDQPMVDEDTVQRLRCVFLHAVQRLHFMGFIGPLTTKGSSRGRVREVVPKVVTSLR